MRIKTDICRKAVEKKAKNEKSKFRNKWKARKKYDKPSKILKQIF